MCVCLASSAVGPTSASRSGGSVTRWTTAATARMNQRTAVSVPGAARCCHDNHWLLWLMHDPVWYTVIHVLYHLYYYTPPLINYSKWNKQTYLKNFIFKCIFHIGGSRYHKNKKVHFQFLEITFSSEHQITELSFKTPVTGFKVPPGKGWGVKVNRKFLTLMN